MKKVFSFYWLLSLVLCISFVGCSDDDNENALEKNYFTVQNANYVDKSIPSGSENLISGIEMNHSVINGGSSIVSFTSSKELSKVYVGVAGISGYYEYPVTSNLKSTQENYPYEVTLLLSQSLADAPFSVSLSGVSTDGTTSAVKNSSDIDVIIVGTGKLQISLSWDQVDDVDLHIFEPNGHEVYYGNRFSSDDVTMEFKFYCSLVDAHTKHKTTGLDPTKESDWETLESYMDNLPDSLDMTKEIADFAKKNSGKINGYLDLDSNAGCTLDGVNSENITYSKIPDGTYTVAVDLWQKCNSIKPGSKYSITVNFDGKPVTISNKQAGKFSNTNPGNWDDANNFVIIGAFTVSGNKITQATPPQSLRSSSLRSSSATHRIKEILKK